MEVLKKLGLDEKEIKVYLALIKVGRAAVDLIKRETGIERTHIYKILERLEDKNFATSVVENGVKIFTPTSPEKLLYDLKNTERELKMMIPQLVSFGQKENVRVSIYRGKEGLKKVAEYALMSADEYLVLGDQGKFQEIMPIFSKQLMKRLEEGGVKEKVLVEHGKKVVKSKNTSLRYVPKGYKFPSTTVVFADNVLIIIWSQPFGILIESKELADSYRAQFNALWKISQK
ncbi:hypothetical protein KY330_00115 [Candidatus Woesearchaeota archaeon]|nr:hypothetical protein [Candidatus Woesearchaeota archaeon]